MTEPKQSDFCCWTFRILGKHAENCQVGVLCDINQNLESMAKSLEKIAHPMFIINWPKVIGDLGDTFCRAVPDPVAANIPTLSCDHVEGEERCTKCAGPTPYEHETRGDLMIEAHEYEITFRVIIEGNKVQSENEAQRTQRAMAEVVADRNHFSMGKRKYERQVDLNKESG